MIVAVDIGASKTLVASFNDAAEIDKKEKFPTDKEFDAFITHLTQVLNDTFNMSQATALSVASTGRINYNEGIVLSAGNLEWRNIPIRERLQQHFNIPIVLENDAKAGALGEARALEQEPAGSVLYVTISTGIGAGLVSNGRLVKELSWMEPGFMLLPHDGALTPWERFASGKAIYERYGKYARDIDDPAVWQAIAKDLAVGFINMILFLRPALIIVGGSIGSHLEKYHDYLIDELEQLKPRITQEVPPIVKAKHPEEAVVYGCYEKARDYLSANQA